MTSAQISSQDTATVRRGSDDDGAVTSRASVGSAKGKGKAKAKVRVSDSYATTPLLQRTAAASRPEPTIKRKSIAYRLLILLLLLVAAFLGIFHFPHPWSTTPPPLSQPATSLLPNATLTNGTHTFRRTVILLSLDGAKPSYLTPHLAPHLTALGLSTPHSRLASHLQPIFPTLTFPNHWSLLTGLFASSHGIVANDFTDAGTGKRFYYTNPAQSWESSWWRGEPVWATAQRSQLNSAVLMWPGPPVTAAGVAPRWFQEYASGPEWGLEARLAKILEWIDVDEVQERASLICAYVPDIDQASHRFGPQSREVSEAVTRVDGFVGRLREEIVEQRGLGPVVDFVVVSDHGMTETSNERLVFLDELLGHDLYVQLQDRDGWPSAGLRFKGTAPQRDELQHKAFQRLSSLPPEKRRGWTLYTRQSLPRRYHLSHGNADDRLAPLWLIPDLGWSITTHAEMATFADATYAPKGNHGYDNLQSDMHAIFIASGPSFRARSSGKEVEEEGKRWNMQGFENVQVHNLVSRILGVREGARAPTNGTWAFWDDHLRDGL